MISQLLRCAFSRGLLRYIAGGLLYTPLFFTGINNAIQFLPGYFERISNYTSIGAAVDALDSAKAKKFPSIAPFLVMATFSVFLSCVAIRNFRWE